MKGKHKAKTQLQMSLGKLFIDLGFLFSHDGKEAIVWNVYGMGDSERHFSSQHLEIIFRINKY